VNRIVDGISSVIYAAPVTNLLVLSYFKIVGRDRDRVANGFTAKCKAEKTVELKIFCLTKSIHAYVNALPKYENGVTFDARTFCAVAANLFEGSFNGLKIPRARAGYLPASISLPTLHVVNTVSLTAIDGRVFGYAVDAGLLPEIFFPTSAHALEHHDPNQDGEIDLIVFPDVDFTRPPTRMIFRPVTN
ncbi:MAG: hypothetical protein V4760_01000, partial [Bdellovibrionota bacterium]